MHSGIFHNNLVKSRDVALQRLYNCPRKITETTIFKGNEISQFFGIKKTNYPLKRRAQKLVIVIIAQINERDFKNILRTAVVFQIGQI